MTAPKAASGDAAPLVSSPANRSEGCSPEHGVCSRDADTRHRVQPSLLLDRAFPGEPLWPILIDSTWEPRVIPNPIPEMNLGVWDALVDVVLDVCCWLFRKATRTQ